MNTNGQDNPWQAAVDRAEQFTVLAKQFHFAAFVFNVLTGAMVAEALNVIAVGQAQRAGQDPFWWVLGTGFVVLPILAAASIRYTVLNRRLRALKLNGQS